MWATALRRDSYPSRKAVPIVEQYCLEPDRWIVKVNPVPPELEAGAQLGADSCPERAITIERTVKA